MKSDKTRFEGGLRHYHRQGDGRGDSGEKALGWDERRKQLNRGRRRRTLLMVGSLVLVLGVVIATFVLMAA